MINYIDFIIILNSSYYIESILINRYFNYYNNNFFSENGFDFHIGESYFQITMNLYLSVFICTLK